MMKKQYSFKKEYSSPVAEVCYIAVEQTVMSDTETIGGGGDPDTPWPETP